MSLKRDDPLAAHCLQLFLVGDHGIVPDTTTVATPMPINSISPHASSPLIRRTPLLVLLFFRRGWPNNDPKQRSERPLVVLSLLCETSSGQCKLPFFLSRRLTPGVICSTSLYARWPFRRFKSRILVVCCDSIVVPFSMVDLCFGR